VAPSQAITTQSRAPGVVVCGADDRRAGKGEANWLRRESTGSPRVANKPCTSGPAKKDEIFLDCSLHFEDHKSTCSRANKGAVAVGQPELPQGNQNQNPGPA